MGWFLQAVRSPRLRIRWTGLAIGRILERWDSAQWCKRLQSAAHSYFGPRRVFASPFVPRFQQQTTSKNRTVQVLGSQYQRVLGTTQYNSEKCGRDNEKGTTPVTPHFMEKNQMASSNGREQNPSLRKKRRYRATGKNLCWGTFLLSGDPTTVDCCRSRAPPSKNSLIISSMLCGPWDDSIACFPIARLSAPRLLGSDSAKAII